MHWNFIGLRNEKRSLFFSACYVSVWVVCTVWRWQGMSWVSGCLSTSWGKQSLGHRTCSLQHTTRKHRMYHTGWEHFPTNSHCQSAAGIPLLYLWCFYYWGHSTCQGSRLCLGSMSGWLLHYQCLSQTSGSQRWSSRRKMRPSLSSGCLWGQWAYTWKRPNVPSFSSPKTCKLYQSLMPWPLK